MSDLELRLVALRDEIEWPETPELLPLPDLAARPRHRRPGRRVLVLAVALVIAVLAGVLALSPGARSAFLQVFHIRGATVEQVDTLPQVEANRLDLGRRVSREEAERVVGIPLVDVGTPDAVYVRGRTASLVYGPAGKPRLVLSEGPGELWEGFMKKVAGSGTSVAWTPVNGTPGLFVSGGDHYVMFLGEDGTVHVEKTFLAGTVLLWNRGKLLLRLESKLTRDEALALARSVR
jgi:hypothetical protein